MDRTFCSDHLERLDLLLAEAVREALLDLPVLQREVLVLAHWGGYSQREIATLTNSPLGTVKTRCLTGMRRLRLVLDSTSSVAVPPAA